MIGSKLTRHYTTVTLYLTLLITLLLSACASNHQAPVIERAPVTKKPVVNKSATKAADKDWRPDAHIVKKGDTLYSIGLQYGYDYKEIAQANNIAPPYTIHIGQQLKLKELNTPKLADSKVIGTSSNSSSSDGVVITPLKSDTSASSAAVTTNPVSSVVSEPPLLSEPKAIREPYSEQAMIVKPPLPTKPVTAASQVKPLEAKTTETPKPEASKPDVQKADSTGSDDDTIDWAWPTAGKVITTFNDSTNAKGIDISGSAGQPVNAAAAGKVIYSGSDLRGYGKLVIIKHNKTYLSVYAHNSQILVKEGQAIAKGQKIAEMGSTDADRVKLHFEIRQQGKSIDPGKYLPGN